MQLNLSAPSSLNDAVYSILTKCDLPVVDCKRVRKSIPRPVPRPSSAQDAEGREFFYGFARESVKQSPSFHQLDNINLG